MSLAFKARDIDAERALISACVLMPELLDTVQEVVSSSMFTAPQHRLVWQAVEELREHKLTVDLVSVAGLLEQKGTLSQLSIHGEDGKQVHGRTALIQLVDATPAVARPEELARRIEELARVRRLSAECERLLHTELGTADVEEFLAQAERRIGEAVTGASREEAEQGLAQHVAERLVHQLSGGDPRSKTPVGFGGLGELLDTWKPKLYVVAGQPGSGKSALMLQMAESVAERGQGVVYLSYEMEREELLLRQLSQRTNVSTRQLTSRFRAVRARHLSTSLARLPELAALPVFYDYCPGLRLEGVLARIRRDARVLQRERRVPLGMVVIDYLQLIRSENQHGTRAEELSTLTSELVALSGQLGVPVVIGSQLNRDHIKRQEKRPIMQDLRDSGGIESDAFAIMALYRPDKGSVVECILLKQRGGTTGTAYLDWDGPTTKFSPSEQRPIDDLGKPIPREEEFVAPVTEEAPAPLRVVRRMSQAAQDAIATDVADSVTFDNE